MLLGGRPRAWNAGQEIGLEPAPGRHAEAPGQKRKRPIGEVRTPSIRLDTPHFVSGVFRNETGSSSWMSRWTSPSSFRASSRSKTVLRRSRRASTSGFR